MKKKQATEEQKAAAKARRAMITEVCKRISVMPKDTRAAIGLKLGIRNVEGHELTPYNQILLHLQRASVSIVGGFAQWRSTNRRVKKGAKALGIWIPIAGASSAEPTSEELTTGEESTGGRSRFIIGNVFDISDTEPADGSFTDVEAPEPLALPAPVEDGHKNSLGVLILQ
jgi:hypothetical protein